ncbi:hypothetical protein [Flindersiella endophytica]
MTARTAIDWLLASDEPAVRALTRRDVLGLPGDESDADVLAGPKVSALLTGREPKRNNSPYSKWDGIHWRLVSLAELEAPADDPRVAAAAEQELAWISRQGPYRGRVVEVAGLTRVCGSVGGNALAVSCRFGLAGDPRAALVAESLAGWQWPDGGWNCDRNASGYRSSFHETLSTAWGLHEFAQATGESFAQEAAERAVELFLDHRLLYQLGTEQVINRRWLELRYPSYWRYDLLRVLWLLERIGRLDDPRTQPALDELERRRLPDGCWTVDGRWWRPEPTTTTPEVVDWGEPGQPNEMVTLNALRILRAAGRFSSGR